MTVSINAEVMEEDKIVLMQCLLDNIDISAWSASYMPGISPDVAYHHLNISPDFRPVKQKKRVVAMMLAEPIREEVSKLLKENFVKEIQYP